MAREFAKRFYKSKAWQECRASYLKSVGGLCERCYKKGLIVPATTVHHKIWLTGITWKPCALTVTRKNTRGS